MGEWKFVQMVLVTWPRWQPCPYMVKTFKNLLLQNRMTEPNDRSLKLGIQHLALKYYQFLFEWRPQVDLWFLAHLSRRLTRWAYRMGVEPASVRASTLSNMNISETSRPITTKFYLKHHWGGGKAALGFDADQIRSLVSMATDSSHRVIMGKRASSRFLDCFWSDPFYTCR